MKKNKGNNILLLVYIGLIMILVLVLILVSSKSDAQVSYPFPTPLPIPYFSSYYIFPPFPYLPLPVQSPIGLVTPSVSLSPLSTVGSPVASISGLLTDLYYLGSTDISITPFTVDFLINTGNPQVDSVLSLIAYNPALLDDPFLLNSLINTGNPDVAFYLNLLSLSY